MATEIVPEALLYIQSGNAGEVEFEDIDEDGLLDSDEVGGQVLKRYQRNNLEPLNVANAIVIRKQTLSREEAAYFVASIDEALTEEGPVTEVSIRVHNARSDFVDTITSPDRDSYMLIEGGYENSAIAPIQPLFRGVIESVNSHRSGADVVVNINCINASSAYFSAPIFYGEFIETPDPDGDGDAAEVTLTTNQSYAAIIRGIFAQVGFVLRNIPPELSATTANNVTFSGYASAPEAVNEILAEASARFRKNYVITMPPGSGPFQIDVINITDADVNQRRIVTIKLDSELVYSVGFNQGKVSDSTVFGLDPLGEERLRQLESLNNLKEVQISMIFNPLLHAGETIQYKGEFEGDGVVRIHQVSHDLSSWTTTIRGFVMQFTSLRTAIEDAFAEYQERLSAGYAEDPTFISDMDSI